MQIRSSCATALLTAILLVIRVRGETNDRMYLPAPAAKAAIDIDGRGFIIHGQRAYVASGSIHYARVPHELWRDRLLRLQRASFNCVQTYAFWNFHEPRENAFDFAGDHDIGAFLSTAQALGLYATVRPGPYVCAEWDSGGWPVWLKFKPSMRVRTDDPAYLALNDHWYDKILPIIASHQIHRGGNVIMVQLENEHPDGWGVIENSPYFGHLENKAEAAGIEVPHFMSGLHHGNGPVPDNPDTSKRTNPWYSTEFWPGWFDLYGSLGPSRFKEVEHDNWSIMARGGAGHNFYMAHGGTNFDTWNDDSGAASYDYGAAIGQAGDLRPIYFRMKRANQVAASFGDILADGADASGEYKDLASGADVMGARHSAAGTLVFLHNPASAEATAKFKDGSIITMEKSESFALPRDVMLAPGLKIADATVRVLAVAQDGDTITVVTYGKPGDTGRLVFATGQPMREIEKSGGLSDDLNDPLRPRLTVKFPTDTPADCTLGDGPCRLRVVAVNSDSSLYTWLLGPKGRQAVVVGPQFVADFEEKDHASSLLIERPYDAPSCGQVAVFGRGAPQHLAVAVHPSMDTAAPPELGNWQMSTAREAAPDFDASKWKQSENPLQMGADGDTSAFAWYRASFTADAPGTGTLRLDGADNVAVFVNGQLAANDEHHGDRREVEVPMVAGANTVAVFTSHAGRDKAFGYLGPLNDFHPKGLFGPVTLTLNGRETVVKNWSMRGGVNPGAVADTPVAVADTRGVPAMFRASFRADKPPETGAHPIYRLTYTGLSRGTMWLNGHNLGRYPEKIRVTSLYLPECWLNAGQNTVTVFDESGHAPTQVRLITETEASREIIRVDQPCDPATPMVLPVADTSGATARLNAGNLAFGKPATASSAEADNPAMAATDGDETSRWCADNDHTGQWLQVDLGAPTSATACEIVWEHRALSYRFVLEGSADGQTWTRLGDDTTAVAQSPDSPSPLSRLDFSGRPIRYARVTVTGGVSEHQWASICELRLMNTY